MEAELLTVDADSHGDQGSIRLSHGLGLGCCGFLCHLWFLLFLLIFCLPSGAALLLHIFVAAPAAVDL